MILPTYMMDKTASWKTSHENLFDTHNAIAPIPPFALHAPSNPYLQPAPRIAQ